MRASACELQEILDRRPQVGDLRLRWASPSHRHDDEIAVVRKQARHVARDGRLPEALARPDHGERREVERLVLRDAQREIGAFVGDSEREEPAREAESLPGPSTGSSETSTATSGSKRESASSRSAASGTPYSSPPTSFSVPPTSSAPTTSCGISASASRTTGA